MKAAKICEVKTDRTDRRNRQIYNYSWRHKYVFQKWIERGFPGGAVVESLPANAGDAGSSPGLGRSHMPWSN